MLELPSFLPPPHTCNPPLLSWVLDNPPSDRSGSVYLDLYDQDENKVFAVADGLQSQNLGEQFGSPEHYGDLGQGYYAKGTY